MCCQLFVYVLFYTASHLSTSGVTDPANRLTSDDSYTYVYDLNGNLISKLAKAGAPEGTEDWGYLYDALDQLILVTRNGVPTESYRYDAFGRRSAITTDGHAEMGIINDGSDRVIDVLADNGGTILRRYTHSDNVDEPLQLETFDSTGSFDARYTYHTDHLGSVRFITDAVGTVVNAYDYDSYGREVSAMEGVEQPFRYTGREWDEAAELYHYRARAYDPTTGRFLQEDPIWFSAGDYNVYRYVLSNPLSFTDPSGQTGLSAGQNAALVSAYIGGVAALGARVECLYNTLGAILDALDVPSSQSIIGIDADFLSCTATAIKGAARGLGTYYGIRYFKPIYRTCKPSLYFIAQSLLNLDPTGSMNTGLPERHQPVKHPPPKTPQLEGKSPGKC